MSEATNGESRSSGGSLPEKAEPRSSHPTPGLRFLIPFAIVWLAVTIPLLDMGYGSDTDSWLVARTADVLWTSHVYNPSRSSGFPLLEIGISLLVHTGHYWTANALALAGGVGLLASLVHLGRKGKLRHPHLVLIFVGFLPIILKNATCTVDYVITLAFLSWTFVALSAGRFAVAFVLVGIACGFRPQTVLYFPPLALYTLYLTRSFKRSFFLGVLGAAVAVASYSPVLVTSGIRSGYKDYNLGVFGQILMLGYNGLQPLGIVPTLIIGGIFAHGLHVRKQAVSPAPAEIPHLKFHIGVFVTYGLAFAAMPHEPEYLLPALLSFILVLDGVLDRKSMIAATCAALSYHAFRVEAIAGSSAHRRFELSIRSGYLVRDVAVRRFLLSTRKALTDFTPDRPTLIMFGTDWTIPLNDAFEDVQSLTVYRKKGSDFYIADPLQDTGVDRWRSRGVRVVLWKGWRKDFLALRPRADWPQRVEVIDSLEDFLGTKIEGQPMWPSE